MEYINPEEFLKQSENVKDVLKIWLEGNLNVHDWVKLIEEDMVLWVDSVMDTRKDSVDVGRVFYLGKCVCWSSIHDPNVVPLLTEGQLRKFIEEKTDGKISIDYNWGNDKTVIDIVEKFDECISKIKYKFEINSFNLLHVYWQVACKIAS